MKRKRHIVSDENLDRAIVLIIGLTIGFIVGIITASHILEPNHFL